MPVLIEDYRRDAYLPVRTIEPVDGYTTKPINWLKRSDLMFVITD